ncbi:hypothetical protein M4D57_20265 [Brevibacillus borstelensis]|uniref:hypothetical protein n=1 Tax=Brevibacillus borstelensis TaxID=45462 RepID=UPI0020410CB4|nr:hypothetical protein [Brevibacillus borstelensis]MCM3560902.1 hypothetical protein [Brevibacillus borstelensis]
MNIYVKANELKRKLDEGKTITSDDITAMFEIARKTQRIEDRITYAKMRSKYERQKASE